MTFCPNIVVCLIKVRTFSYLTTIPLSYITKLSIIPSYYPTQFTLKISNYLNILITSFIVYIFFK